MHILRWLMKHPILLAWLLAIVAILLNFSMVDKHGDGQAEHAQAPEAAEHAQAADAGHGAAVATDAAATATVDAAHMGAADTAAAQATVDAGAQSAAPAATASSEADLLRAAREAYWSNELDSAAGFYTSLLQQKPDSLEYKGELANVYWKQGNARQAAELFAEIAPQLAAQGRVTEAFNMKLYVDMVDPELAKKIDAALK
ncbi:MAG: hypothetical protein KJ914_06110 [Gammaproteobacteria bacterium]|nr:hypothetical protein [Gammaproteobacteria bacterium]MBU1724720.1 hypothetical protein [Gammaproteobacteria bacterium]MBU2006039.1 hypothetical protein [Gammaproteobacteria bacterium]